MNPHPPALGVQPQTLIVAPVLMKPASTLAQAAQTLAGGTKHLPTHGLVQSLLGLHVVDPAEGMIDAATKLLRSGLKPGN